MANIKMNADGKVIVNFVTFTKSGEALSDYIDYHLPGRNADELMAALNKAGFKIVDETSTHNGAAVSIMTVTRDRREHRIDMGLVSGSDPYYYFPEKSMEEMAATLEKAGFERVHVIDELFKRQ